MPTTGKILIINLVHHAIGSRIPNDHLPPLALLCITGPLLDESCQVWPLNIVDEVVKESSDSDCVCIDQNSRGFLLFTIVVVKNIDNKSVQ